MKAFALKLESAALDSFDIADMKSKLNGERNKSAEAERCDVVAFAFLYAAITGTGGIPTINWPASANYNYNVQYKDNLSDPIWQPLSGAVTIIGNRGYQTDSTSTSPRRFYRVQLGN